MAARNSPPEHESQNEECDRRGLSGRNVNLRSVIMQVEGFWEFAVEALNGHLTADSLGIHLSTVVRMPRKRSGRYPRRSQNELAVLPVGSLPREIVHDTLVEALAKITCKLIVGQNATKRSGDRSHVFRLS